jgi:ectoine hydroxylase
VTTATTLSPYRSRVSADPVVVPREEPVVWGDRNSGPLDADALDVYDARGFLTFDELLSPPEVEAFERELNVLVRRDDLAHAPQVIREPGSQEVRSVFAVHELSEAFGAVVADPRIADVARQVLGSDVYVHQSRVNLKPGFRGRDFYWHSDFETWHLEDGLPQMRTVSFSISLTENRPDNGSLMIVPGSHRTFIGCVGATPERHYEQSLRSQEYGVPDDATLTALIAEHGIATVLGGPGSAVMFDSNCMHGSNSNITPFPRANVFVVYNSVENTLVEPFSGQEPRPAHIADRTFEPVG